MRIVATRPHARIETGGGERGVVRPCVRAIVEYDDHVLRAHGIKGRGAKAHEIIRLGVREFESPLVAGPAAEETRFFSAVGALQVGSSIQP